MLIGRVIGDVVATQKHASHHGRKALLVQPLNLDGSARGDAVVALDAVDVLSEVHGSIVAPEWCHVNPMWRHGDANGGSGGDGPGREGAAARRSPLYSKLVSVPCDGPSGLATDQRARAHAPSGRDAGDETWEEEPRRLLYRGGIQLGILECYLSSQRFRISSLASCDMPIAAPSNVEASSTFSGCGVLHFVGSKRFLQKATIRLATRDDSTKANSPQYSSQNRASVFSRS